VTGPSTQDVTHAMLWEDERIVGVRCARSGPDFTIDAEGEPCACPVCGVMLRVHWHVWLERVE